MANLAYHCTKPSTSIPRRSLLCLLGISCTLCPIRPPLGYMDDNSQDRTTYGEVRERNIYPTATTPRLCETFRLSDQGLPSQDWSFTDYWHDPAHQNPYNSNELALIPSSYISATISTSSADPSQYCESHGADSSAIFYAASTFQGDGSVMDTQAFPWGTANMGQSSHVSVHGEQADIHLTSSYSLVETPYDQPAPPSNRIIQIPQVRYVHPSKKGRTRYGRPIDLGPILFCLVGSGEEGILASDAFDGFRQSTLHLEGADDVVFRADHARNITMHILWPECTPWKALISTKCFVAKQSVPITRGLLAKRIADQLVSFTKIPHPSTPGSTVPSPAGLRLDQITIRRFYPVSQGAWQVDLAVTVPVV